MFYCRNNLGNLASINDPNCGNLAILYQRAKDVSSVAGVPDRQTVSNFGNLIGTFTVYI